MKDLRIEFAFKMKEKRETADIFNQQKHSQNDA